MGGERDEVYLTQGERDRLAAIERALSNSDPRLTRRLARFRWVNYTLLLANVLVVVGNALVVATTLTSRLWLGPVGFALMAAGLSLWAYLAFAWFKRR